MESTGIYWQPVFNLLEGHFQTWVVNAQHIKKVAGRKTDMKDAEWIAQLLQCGLLSRVLSRTASSASCAI
jgi:transposase